jgi:hypothetical protein
MAKTRILLAPHKGGPRDVPLCGALTLLKSRYTTGGFSRNRSCTKCKKMLDSVVVVTGWWWRDPRFLEQPEHRN